MQILEVRMLAANDNKDISFDYMRLFTEYSKIMLVYQWSDSDQNRSTSLPAFHMEINHEGLFHYD